MENMENKAVKHESTLSYRMYTFLTSDKKLYRIELEKDFFKLESVALFSQKENIPYSAIANFESAFHTVKIRYVSDGSIPKERESKGLLAFFMYEEFSRAQAIELVYELALRVNFYKKKEGITFFTEEELDQIKVKGIDAFPKKGCYIATSVYGSYDCPQVWTLRRYRDEVLGSTWYGRLFIKLYYAISPTLVKWFGKTKWFQKMWQGKLDKMVAKLNAKGFDDTLYEDKVWK